jgi:hypothetical protein
MRVILFGCPKVVSKEPSQDLVGSKRHFVAPMISWLQYQIQNYLGVKFRIFHGSKFVKSTKRYDL